MRVLWIDLISEFGGAQHSMLEVCKTLPQFGIETMAAVPHGPLFEGLSQAGLRVFPVTPVRARKRGWGFFSTVFKLIHVSGTISHIVKTVRPDIIHANSLPAFLAACRMSSPPPVIWHVRDLRLPMPVARQAGKKAARIIAASSAIDEYLVNILSSRVLGHIRVIRNGIDPAPFANGDRTAARAQFNLPPDVPIVGMAAHLTPWKRHDAFIEAAAHIHRQRTDVHFAAVGRDLFHENAHWEKECQGQIAAAGLTEAFHWIKTCDAIQEVLPAFSLLLHPALDEPFGRVICEAMAAALPVIAADTGGPAEIIQPGVSGILVRDGDPQQMAREALALLSDPARAARLGAAGRDRVLKQFTTRRVCESLEKEYRALLAENNAAFPDQP